MKITIPGQQFLLFLEYTMIRRFRQYEDAENSNRNIL